MNIIVRFKQLIRRSRITYEVWDTSAVCTWLDLLISKIEGKDPVIIIIPEGVVHELSAGRRNHPVCRKAFAYIESIESKKLIKKATADAIRTWTIDEQVVTDANEYYKKGHKVALVTCDRDQAYKAKLKGITVNLLKGKGENFETPNEGTNYGDNIQEPKSYDTMHYDNVPNSKDEIFVSYIRRGKEIFIKVSEKIAVYDARGKRRIGKQEMIPVTQLDRFVYKNNNYQLQSIGDSVLTLKRV